MTRVRDGRWWRGVWALSLLVKLTLFRANYYTQSKPQPAKSQTPQTHWPSGEIYTLHNDTTSVLNPSDRGTYTVHRRISASNRKMIWTLSLCVTTYLTIFISALSCTNSPVFKLTLYHLSLFSMQESYFPTVTSFPPSFFTAVNQIVSTLPSQELSISFDHRHITV